MEVTITRITKFDKDRNGIPLSTKTGKRYTSLRFQCNEYGSRWVSGFENHDNKDWKEGDTVDVNIEEKGDYLNFSMPKKENRNIVANPELTRKLDEIITKLNVLTPMVRDIWNWKTSEEKTPPFEDGPF
jgi:hypothetical protein